MNKVLLAAVAALVLAGCSARDRNTLVGAGIGAGVGAIIGSASAGPTGGWVGAAVGGLTGGAIGSLVQPAGCYYRNRRGELWQVPCHGRVAHASACYVGDAFGGLQPVRCPRRYR